VLVVLVFFVVAIVVLARMPGTHGTGATAVASPAGTAAPPSVTVPSTTVAPTTTTPTTVPPPSVTVLVLNGWTTEHAALYFQKALASKGYDTRAPGDATSEGNLVSHLFVAKQMYDANALAIAGLLGMSASSVVVPAPPNDSAVPAGQLDQADLVLVVGRDISSQVPTGYSG
jgi:hypothetical protein